jgi:hypothetical protein
MPEVEQIAVVTSLGLFKLKDIPKEVQVKLKKIYNLHIL